MNSSNGLGETATTSDETQIATYKTLLAHPAPPSDEALQREQEEAIVSLGDIYARQRNTSALVSLVHDSQQLTSSFSKAKTAKVLRYLVDLFGSVPGAMDTQITVIRDCIAWAVQGRRVFLRQNLETKL